MAELPSRTAHKLSIRNCEHFEADNHVQQPPSVEIQLNNDPAVRKCLPYCLLTTQVEDQLQSLTQWLISAAGNLASLVGKLIIEIQDCPKERKNVYDIFAYPWEVLRALEGEHLSVDQIHVIRTPHTSKQRCSKNSSNSTDIGRDDKPSKGVTIWLCIARCVSLLPWESFTDAPPGMIFSVMQQVREYARHSREPFNINLRLIPNVTRAKLEGLLKNGEHGRINILHLDCHGVLQDGKVFLRLNDAAPDADLKEKKDRYDDVPAEVLVEMLSCAKVSYLITNACCSASATGHIRGNLGRLLLEAGICHILALSDRFSVVAMSTFFRPFYKTFLGLRHPFDEAFAAGIAGLRAEFSRVCKTPNGMSEWTVPVHYGQETDVYPPIEHDPQESSTQSRQARKLSFGLSSLTSTLGDTWQFASRVPTLIRNSHNLGLEHCRQDHARAVWHENKEIMLRLDGPTLRLFDVLETDRIIWLHGETSEKRRLYLDLLTRHWLSLDFVPHLYRITPHDLIELALDPEAIHSWAEQEFPRRTVKPDETTQTDDPDTVIIIEDVHQLLDTENTSIITPLQRQKAMKMLQCLLDGLPTVYQATNLYVRCPRSPWLIFEADQPLETLVGKQTIRELENLNATAHELENVLYDECKMES